MLMRSEMLQSIGLYARAGIDFIRLLSVYNILIPVKRTVLVLFNAEILFLFIHNMYYNMTLRSHLT